MITYTVQFEIDGNGDEFWEGNPSPQDVIEMITLEMQKLYPALDWHRLKIVKIVDKTVYENLDIEANESV